MSDTYHQFEHYDGFRRTGGHTVIRRLDGTSDLVYGIVEDPESPFRLLKKRMENAMKEPGSGTMGRLLKEGFEKSILDRGAFFSAIECKKYCEDKGYTQDNIQDMPDEELGRIFMFQFKVSGISSQIVYIRL